MSFASFSYLSRSVFVFLDITNQTDGFEADQVRMGWLFYLPSPGRIYTTIASFFGFLGLVLFYIALLLLFNTPMRKRQYTYCAGHHAVTGIVYFCHETTTILV